MEDFKNFADLGKHKTVKSHLFGNLEMPGFKGFPSKNGTMMTGRDNNVVPDQGIFEIKSALVRPKLNNGRMWNEYGKELPSMAPLDKYPKIKPGQPFPLSNPTGALNDVGKASNPEMITGFGFMPSYPEEERIKDMLAKPPKLGKESVFYKEREAPIREEPVYEGVFDERREKYQEARLNQLAAMGFSEDMIAEALIEEQKRDLAKAIVSPNLMNEAKLGSEIERVYENWVTKRNMMKTGENAAGITGSAGVQNPGVRAYDSFASNAAGGGPIQVKSGVQRLRAEMAAAGVDSRIAFDTDTNEDGTGPGGLATFEAMEKFFRSRGRRPGFVVSAETKAKIGFKIKEKHRERKERKAMMGEDVPA